jgi:hypothetical protein
MIWAVSRVLTSAIVCALLGVGCSTIFGAEFDGFGASAGDAGVVATGEGGVAKTPVDEPEAPGIDGKCKDDRKLCAGLCVSLRDPRYGCAANTCEPCSIARGVAACENGACVIGSCEAGRGSCNGDVADGCETSLTSDPEHCGACETKCGTDRVCGPTGCGTSCGPGLEACGGSCVDKATDEKHCGTCNNACPSTANGVASCVNRNCTVKCNTGFNYCTGQCVASSPTSCGPTCKTCTAPANATPTCTAQETCGFKCNIGYGLCAGDPTRCCLTAPVCSALGATCNSDSQCCTNVCLVQCLCMSVGQSCTEDRNCCDGKKCGFYDGSPNKCKPN